ncbi:hypothetical protein PACTADRAFT_35455 [Pachysolen tannophilus NRRL Y-2460]|uniref:Uncharacterized protein n=1 Tax=Pachysolen tannophilus NRRL Y-2460 TaxID=669874 RepID=A0A1E4TPR2_PACTA|nr:hypothetical protein PACTADRAFT_35455 [Pachysolen tannophilus NRRL Y-2460]
MQQVITILEPQSGLVHEYAPRLTAFEFTNKKSGIQSKKVVLFIGGLTDGLLTVPYLPKLAEGLDGIGWSLVQILFSSSYTGWGTGSLKRDADEISLLVQYLRSERGGNRSQVVLFGHSTGCQDTVQYLSKFTKTSKDMEVDGGILQAPASDREAISTFFNKEKIAEYSAEAREYIKQGKSEHTLPKKFSDAFLGAPVSAYRWLSLAEVGGDDDFFSSDLTKEYLTPIFGNIKKPLLVLYSGNDECVPDHVDKQKLIDGWKETMDPQFWSRYSKVVPGAKHNVGPGSDKDALKILIDSACSFLQDL